MRAGSSREVVTLYTRAGCHLCDEALGVLREVQAQHAFELKIVDISEDAILLARYRMDIPVVVFREERLFRHRVDAERLARLLQELGEASNTTGLQKGP
ncbi:MAG TPA: glutaredoxin family protein [Myxococcaceae bacterium]|nr:glutaredoxin family protein [Myxococcaceae bacterium]